jgi:hypothetical protein
MAQDIPDGAFAYLKETLGVAKAGHRDLIQVRPPTEDELRPGARCAARPRGGLSSAEPTPRILAAGTGELSGDGQARPRPL